MLRVDDQAELGQSDTVVKYAEKVGLKSDDIQKLMETFKKAKDVYSASKKKPASPSAPVAPQYYAPTSTNAGIGILPIIVILAGVGVVAYAFMRK